MAPQRRVAARLRAALERTILGLEGMHAEVRTRARATGPTELDALLALADQLVGDIATDLARLGAARAALDRVLVDALASDADEGEGGA